MNNMAKLNVVIPAVEVTVDGVAYRKVDRKAQAGDIVKALMDEDSSIITGEYYGPIYEDSDGDLGFDDNDEDFRWMQLRAYAERYEVYAPISETITFEGATWRKVDRDVREGDAIKFTNERRRSYLTGAELYVVDRVDSCDDPQITDDDGDEYDAGGEDYEVYEKVAEEKAETVATRKANAGDRVRIVARLRVSDPYNNGDVLTVIKRLDSQRVTLSVNGESAIARDEEFVVLEPVTKSAKTVEPTQPERLAVGDYAKKVGTSGGDDVGTILKITQNDRNSDFGFIYGTERMNGDDGDVYGLGDLVRATDEEVAAAKYPRSQFAIGDYVKVAVEYCEHNVGDVLKITNTASGHDFFVTNVATSRLGCIDADKLAKLTAAEIAEIERKQAEEDAKRAEEAKWSAIGRKVNEYKRGDIVLCVGKAKAGLGEVQADATGSRVSVKYYSSFGTCSETFGIISLVSPVEQRFDRSADDVAEEVAAA